MSEEEKDRIIRGKMIWDTSGIDMCGFWMIRTMVFLIFLFSWVLIKYPSGVAIISLPAALKIAISLTITCLVTLNFFAKS